MHNLISHIVFFYRDSVITVCDIKINLMLKRFSQSALNPVSSINITAECKCLLNHRGI